MATTRVVNVTVSGGSIQSPLTEAVLTQEDNALDALSKVIADGGSGSFVAGFNANPNPVIFDCTRPQPTLPAISGAHGVAITPGTVTVQYGYAAYSFAAYGLPAGLSINAGTGQISGTPTTAGTYAYAVVVTDVNGNVGIAAGSILVT